jgi:hypothetical protein
MYLICINFFYCSYCSNTLLAHLFLDRLLICLFHIHAQFKMDILGYIPKNNLHTMYSENTVEQNFAEILVHIEPCREVKQAFFPITYV